MKAEEFVKLFYKEKELFLKEYFSNNSETEVKSMIDSLNLDNNQQRTLLKILDSSFSDIFYSILLGLDGASSLGGVQQVYEIKDEEGNVISVGDIETFAYEYFQNNENS